MPFREIIGHRRLIAGDLLRALGGLERHGPLLIPAVRPSRCPAVLIAAALLRQVSRPLAQLALGGGHGIGRV